MSTHEAERCVVIQFFGVDTPHVSHRCQGHDGVGKVSGQQRQLTTHGMTHIDDGARGTPLWARVLGAPDASQYVVERGRPATAVAYTAVLDVRHGPAAGQ